MCLPKPRDRDRRDRHRLPPDYYTPIFAQNDLSFYDPQSYTCEAVPVDESLATLLSSQTSDVTIRGHRLGLFDRHDGVFFHSQYEKGFLEDAYSDDFFQCTEENPQKWYEIGVAFRKHHATIVMRDITGTNIDDQEHHFLYIGQGGYGHIGSGPQIRHLHLVLIKETDEHYYYDLSFDVPHEPKEPERYFPVCRIRTTDRMVKYNAGLSFPPNYKAVASDCATFAHNFLIKTLSRALADGHIERGKYSEIVKSLVKHNRVLGETGGALVESS